MIDEQQGQAVGTHIAALLAAKSAESAPDADAVSRIESKLDAALSNISWGESTSVVSSSQNLTTVVDLSTDNATIVQGRSTRTGRRLSGLNHLIQSVGIILLTPIGSRVKRRTFGTRLFELTDWPQNDSTRISIIRTVFDAIDKWEPRLELQQVGIQANKDNRKNGKLNIQLSGIYRGNEVTFGVIA